MYVFSSKLNSPNGTCPLTGSSILLVLSFVSFLPQLRRIWHQRHFKGISLHYVFYNLLLTTEQFTLLFFFMFNFSDASHLFGTDPKSPGNWINLCQLGVVWVMWLIL
jgi:PQ loop repeat.